MPKLEELWVFHEKGPQTRGLKHIEKHALYNFENLALIGMGLNF